MWCSMAWPSKERRGIAVALGLTIIMEWGVFGSSVERGTYVGGSVGVGGDGLIDLMASYHFPCKCDFSVVPSTEVDKLSRETERKRGLEVCHFRALRRRQRKQCGNDRSRTSL